MSHLAGIFFTNLTVYRTVGPSFYASISFTAICCACTRNYVLQRHRNDFSISSHRLQSLISFHPQSVTSMILPHPLLNLIVPPEALILYSCSCRLIDLPSFFFIDRGNNLYLRSFKSLQSFPPYSAIMKFL